MNEDAVNRIRAKVVEAAEAASANATGVPMVPVGEADTAVPVAAPGATITVERADVEDILTELTILRTWVYPPQNQAQEAARRLNPGPLDSEV